MKLNPILGLAVSALLISLPSTQASAQTVSKEVDLSVFAKPKAEFSTVELYGKGRSCPKIVCTPNGNVITSIVQGIRISSDGGNTWSEARKIGNPSSPRIVVDEDPQIVVNQTNNEVLLVYPKGEVWISSDNGTTWRKESCTIKANLLGHGTADSVPISLGAFQAGVTLMHGKHQGRLLLPGRIFGPANSNDNKWRPYHYNTSIYSDDNGKTWQVSAPFPVFGTGEAALAEVSDGRVLYSSREHMTAGNRFFAWSYDDGQTWLNPWRSAELPDGVRSSSYGCMGGLVRLPIEGRDILLYSNLDSDKGEMPRELGGSIVVGRENVTIWVSFDGGKTWPVKRLVCDGTSAYSSLAYGVKGTPSEGKIYILFEAGGLDNATTITKVASLTLNWLLDDKKLSDYLK